MSRRRIARPTNKTVASCIATLEKVSKSIEGMAITLTSTDDPAIIKTIKGKLDMLLSIQNQALKVLKEDSDAVKSLYHIRLLALQEKTDRHLLAIKEQLANATDGQITVNISLEDNDG